VKVLLIHNRYRTSAPSGEDGAVLNERSMLQKRGVEVSMFDRCNDDIDDSTLLAKSATALNTIWSRRSRNELRELIRTERPDIAHVHNTFSMLSPSIYGACKAEGLPVVQTLHNFRFFCPSALFLRDGKPCEDCVERGLFQSVRHRCYRNSVAATATLATMLAVHRTLGTYTDGIDRYIALTEFARRKFIKGGIDAAKLVVKPNFVQDPPAVGPGGGGYALFVGRLLEGKGTHTLLRAWRELPSFRLKIVGDGALRRPLEEMARRENLNVEFAGRLDRGAVLEVLARADILVIPSEWYEGFPMVVAESYACGTPILASRIGSLDELIQEGVTGAKFPAGDASSLASALRRMLADPVKLRRMRAAARAFFDEALTEEQNFKQLMRVYSDLLASRKTPEHLGNRSDAHRAG